MKDIIARDPENVRALVALGGALIREAVEEDPRQIRDLVHSGGKPVESPTLDQAECYLRRAVEAGPHVYSVLMNPAMLFKNRGNFEGARKELEAAMVIKPFSPEPLNDPGVVYDETGRTEAAIGLGEKAREIAPDNHVFHDCLEPWYAGIGRDAESRRAGRRRLELLRQMMREQQQRKRK